MAQKSQKRRRASVRNKPGPRPVAAGQRPAKHWVGNDPDGIVVIGRELRRIANRLKLAESCLIVVSMALDCQDVENDDEIFIALNLILSRDIFEPIRDLENVAAKCDGGRRSDRNDGKRAR